MSFHSMLRLKPETVIETSAPPAFFGDLNLDQVVAALTAGKQDYNLAPYFHRPMTAWDEIDYRQRVMRDLEDAARFEAVVAFAEAMRTVRERLTQAEKLYYRHQKQAWHIDAVEAYCRAVSALHDRLAERPPQSAGLSGFADFLAFYVASPRFAGLVGEIEALKAKLASISYTLLINGSVITVSDYDGEPDYGVEIEADFAKFRQSDAAEYQFKFVDFVQMNHIEAGVLDRVAKLHEDIFAELDAFATRNADFIDPAISTFDREAQFYLAYVSHMRRLQAAGLRFCYPAVSSMSKTTRVAGGYDLALAKSLADQGLRVVTNDFHLDGRERIIVVSGPNQGGKTTFARMFGQIHYLAALGCPVPADEAQLFLLDGLFTHFERGEDIHNLRGKLHDDLTRLHDTLAHATSSSIIILNEVFSSTSLSDAVFLSSEILRRILARDALCVCVTFIDELADLSNSIVSMASQVEPGNEAERTFKVVRQKPNGLAYAMSLAHKHHLTYEQLRERLRA